MVEYYCFIRPSELRYVTVGDISIEEQSIYIRPEISKNRKGQRVAVNDSLMRMMISLKVFSYPSHYYLFSDNFMPGEHLIYINAFRLEWLKVRKALQWPDSYQFYSLKDSGIRDLANAEGIVTARDQARHSDVAVTNQYLKQGSNVHEETKHFKGEL
jgi:integrase